MFFSVVVLHELLFGGNVLVSIEMVIITLNILIS